jgi:protein-S-isoprenylcysteine O-methyltransferase Ste14
MPHVGHPHLAGEAHRSHQIQIGLFIFFLIVWILDSFLFRITPLVYFVPFYVNIIPGLVIIIVSLILMQKSHIVFEGHEPHVVTTSVYSRVRHPMYLGSILLYFGFWISTLSFITLLPLLCVVISYNYLANREEQFMEEKFGDEYEEYKKQVRKWIP